MISITTMTLPERVELAGSKLITNEQQRMLAEDESEAVLQVLAENPSLAPQFQLILANDTNWVVRMYLATNESLIPELQSVLLRDEDRDVRRLLARNSSLKLRLSLPVSFLHLSKRGRKYLKKQLSDLDPEVLDALMPWSGTLEELRSAALSFA